MAGSQSLAAGAPVWAGQVSASAAEGGEKRPCSVGGNGRKL